LALAATIQQKRAEREARRRRRLAAAAAADADADAETEAIGGGGEEQEEEEGKRGAPAPTSSVVYTVSVPTTSDALAWYNYADDDPASGQQQQQQRRRTYETLDAARAAGVWSYPASAEDRARCEVFRDLWERGYYMGGGVKFGGDWLVYPGPCFYSFSFWCASSLLSHLLVLGDPLRYHSHFVATVQTSPDAPLRPMQVVAHGRLGTATKKAHLLCGWDPESREVTYISVEWAGFG
jgi:tRNA-splicing endonuclease subunit Sen34